MPQVVLTQRAIRDLQRLEEFLRPKNPAAAKRASETIIKAAQMLGSYPHMGRPVQDMTEQYREWLINFGDSGYVARYHFDHVLVTILALRHQKEAGF